MVEKPPPRSPLEASLIRAMKAIDNQVAREMQRSPAEREAHGVQKWEPYRKRVEMVSAFLLDALGEQEIDLDSLLVLSEAFTKALYLVVEDLEAKGLGSMRTAYCQQVLEHIMSDARRGMQGLRGTQDLN